MSSPESFSDHPSRRGETSPFNATISRRGVIAGGLGIAASSLLLAACGTTAQPASNATPAKGGVLRIARPIASKGESLDPASSLCAYEYLGALYNRLVKQDKSGAVVPDLATAWQSSNGAKTWTLTLRDGVTFHNGKSFTSADAKYTLQHILDPAVGSPQAGVLSTFLSASGISAPDARTLVLNLSKPNAEFISLLTHYNCYVIPDDSASTIGKTGIGTGPFSLESFTPAGRGSVKANTSYFEGRPVLDGIEFTAIADVQARVNALLGKQVDLIAQTNLDTASAMTVKASANHTTVAVKNAQMYVLPMLFTAAPFTDVNVRQAFKQAFNPTDVLNLAVNGQGTVANSNPILPTNPYYLDYSLPYDQEQAKALLKKAGFDSLNQVLFTSTVDPTLSPLALAYQSAVAGAGINIKVETAAADSYYTNVWMKKPFMASYWYTGRPVDQQLNEVFRSKSSYNESLWSNSQFDGLLDAARAETDEARRKTLYQDAQKVLIDDGSTVIPFFSDRITGLSKSVVGYSEFSFEFDYLNIGLQG
jgi:peptide/nickel transport system substrate-binding protein